ncbi:hypothetical protein HS088_TW17G00130 [Tripterygium wilfordii]|uniref:Uncharacterized protein n=1 Tax=Tripterygium wilfordii TaxID=458696 RepID=A0A7J7CET3_TRIWF|nr:uncharacterized protein LOC119983110 [Tripterygium wilfordii]KAF5732600.1 hypothetical protein HS088_TW17G00130 [Tripterygium wilfordii]
MEGVSVVALSDHNNKENIPPFFPGPVSIERPDIQSLESFKNSSKFSSRRKFTTRKPLADITNLFTNSVAWEVRRDALAPSNLSVSVCTSNPRKRKSPDEEVEFVRVICSDSKSLRMGFR